MPLPAMMAVAGAVAVPTVPLDTSNLLNAASSGFDSLAHGSDVTAGTVWARRTTSITTTQPVVTTTPGEVIDGVGSMKITKDATTTANFGAWQTAANTVPVSASTQYTFSCRLRAPTAATNCVVYVEWFTSGGASAGSGTGQIGGSSTSVATTGSTQVFITITSPATAAWARLVTQVVSMTANHVLIGDQFDFHEGTL